MKKRRQFWAVGLAAVLVLAIVVLLIFLFRPMTMNDIYNEPNFHGTVTKVHDKSILIAVNEDEEEYKSSDLITVSLDVQLKDSMTSFNVGDEVRVYYDGAIAESYPAQVFKVYAILLKSSDE